MATRARRNLATLDEKTEFRAGTEEMGTPKGDRSIIPAPSDVKEIVERLRERAVGQKPVPDGKGGFRWEIYHRDTELETAADLITRLSERVGELERVSKQAHDWFESNRPQWGPGTLPTWFVDVSALLSKQEERG